MSPTMRPVPTPITSRPKANCYCTPAAPRGQEDTRRVPGIGDLSLTIPRGQEVMP
jgi:hypothetical protein